MKIFFILLGILILSILFISSEALKESTLLKLLNNTLKLGGKEYTESIQSIKEIINLIVDHNIKINYNVTGNADFLLDINKILNTSDDIKTDIADLVEAYKKN